MGNKLLYWSKEKFDDLGKQIESTEAALKMAQPKTITQESCEECLLLEKALNDLHNKHEANRYLRSPVSGIRTGDRNISYFHHKASQQQKRNTTEGLHSKNGFWKADEEKFKSIVSKYFSVLFASLEPSESNLQGVLHHVKAVISIE